MELKALLNESHFMLKRNANKGLAPHPPRVARHLPQRGRLMMQKKDTSISKDTGHVPQEKAYDEVSKGKSLLLWRRSLRRRGDEVLYVFRIIGGLLVDASKCVRRDFRMIMCVRGE